MASTGRDTGWIIGGQAGGMTGGPIQSPMKQVSVAAGTAVLSIIILLKLSGRDVYAALAPGAGSLRASDLVDGVISFVPGSTWVEETSRYASKDSVQFFSKTVHLYAANRKAPWDMQICNFKNFCAASRDPKSRDVQYYFIGNESSATIQDQQPAIVRDFETCLFTKYPKHVQVGTVSLDSYEGKVEWVRGNTYGFRKSEPNNHPGTWGGVWASFLATLVYGIDVFEEAGITARDWFDQVQLFEQTVHLNGYASFIMHSALHAGRKSLPGAELGERFHPGRRTPHTSSGLLSAGSVPSWFDETRLYTETSSLLCYENIVSVPASYDYFRTSDLGSYFRGVALNMVGLPPERPRACKRSRMKVVYLMRERPIWNQAELLLEIERSGAGPTYVASITEYTPYQEQVALFYDADLIVSVHGTQLQNQMFMQKGAGLIEIFPANYYHRNQAELAMHTGIDHVQMVDNTFPPEALVQELNPGLLPLLYKNLKQHEKYPNASACGQSMPCYQAAREMGAYVNLSDFRIKLEDLLTRLEDAEGCLSN